MIKEIESITDALGKILVTVEPKTPAEWDAMEKLQAAHKQMRGIEIAELTEKPARATLTR
jgi:hypothetical protein